MSRIGIVLLTVALWAGLAAAQSSADGNGAAAAVDSIQKRILSDPQLAGQVHALSEDPSLREILADPEIADALNRGDYGALLVNPKIHRLAEDPAIRSLTREIAPAD